MEIPTKPKPSEMSSDLRSMIDLRHQAEQRGHYEPLGRLLYLKTAHGVIRWPVENGEAMGPDVAVRVISVAANLHAKDVVMENVADWNALLLLGPWLPLPPVRVNSSTPCPKCRALCDICHGKGEKQCEQVGCGGAGHVAIPGQLPCDAPGCSKETGKINPNGCERCRNSGAIPRLDECEMCHGSKVMTCPVCKGSKKVSTGKVGGSRDYKTEDCRHCHGTGWKAGWKNQDVEQFVNASLVGERTEKRLRGNVNLISREHFLALGPIHAFAIEDSRSRLTRVFDVAQDASGDFLVLLIPAGHKRQAVSKAKAYLVGGVVRERGTAQGAA
jgi:hypothetical protein